MSKPSYVIYGAEPKKHPLRAEIRKCAHRRKTVLMLMFVFEKRMNAENCQGLKSRLKSCPGQIFRVVLQNMYFVFVCLFSAVV